MKKKLAVALNMLSPYWYEAFEELSHKGWDISIFVATEKEKDRKYKDADYSKYAFKVKKSRNMVFDLSRFGLRTRFLHMQIGLWGDLRKYKPDLILSNELGFRTLTSLLYGKMYKVPVVPWVCVSAHTERNNSRFRDSMRSLMVKNVPCVCTNRTEAKKYLLASLNVSPNKIFYTPYAVNIKAYSAVVLKEKRNAANLKKRLKLRGTVFLYVGQMIERKGLKQLVDAVIELKAKYQNKYSLLFVGGTLQDDLVDVLKSNKICFSNISFVQPDDLHQFYAAADALVFPSLEDEWGIVLNEAAASSLPLISSIYAAATTELVKDGINGFVFDPFNKREFAQILEAFLDMSKQKRKHFGTASLKVANKLDMSFTIAQMNKSLHKAI